VSNKNATTHTYFTHALPWHFFLLLTCRQYACEVNNQSFSFPDPNPLTMRLGTVQQWDFNDAYFHPLHVR
jgi:hypothetical protein